MIVVDGRMMKKILLSLVSLFVLLQIPLSASLKSDITVSLEEKQVQELSPSGLNLVFYIRIVNDSTKTYNLSEYNYRFVVNQREYLKLQTPLDEGLQVDARNSTMIALPVKITYGLLFQAIPGVESDDKAVCYLMGELMFSENGKERGSLPFAFTGEFPIFKKPEAEFVSIKVNTLTIGGADVHFEVKFKNMNGFELLVDKINYTLESGGYLIDKDSISGDKNIEARGEKNFTLPFLLNFFEVGKEVHAILQQQSAVVHFFGVLEIKTIWGRIRIPFDENRQVPVVGPSQQDK